MPQYPLPSLGDLRSRLESQISGPAGIANAQSLLAKHGGEYMVARNLWPKMNPAEGNRSIRPTKDICNYLIGASGLLAAVGYETQAEQLSDYAAKSIVEITKSHGLAGAGL